MSGHVYNDDDAHDLNERIDGYQAAMDRQVIRYDVINKEAQVAQEMAGVEQYNDLARELLERKAKGGKLTSQEQEMIKRRDLELRNSERRLHSLKAAISEGRKKLNGAAA